MTDRVKISDLSPAAVLDGSEVAPFVQAGVTVKATSAQIKAYAQSNVPVSNLAGAVAVANGGTGGTTAQAAAQNLSVASQVSSLAALKALSAPSGTQTVIIQYRNTAGDGGGGTWVWRSGDQSANVTADAQSGVWAAPSSATTGASGAWQRLYNEKVNVKWFGAKGNGATNDATAIQAAINFVQSLGGGTLWFPYGTYLINSTLSVTKGIKLEGEGEIGDSASSSGVLTGTTIQWNSVSNSDMMTVKSATAGNYLYGFGVKNIVFYGSSKAMTAIRASSIGNSDFHLSAAAFIEAGVVVDDGNGVLSLFNTYRLRYIYGSAAATEGSHGLVLDGSASDIGVTQSIIYWISGLVKNGWMLKFKDSDGMMVHVAHASVASGGTGGCIYFANGDVRPARSIQVGVMWGKAHAESATYGNEILRAHSEAGGVSIDAGGQLHYTAYDYMNAERWATHSYVMSDQFAVGCNEMQTEIELQNYKTYDPPNLVDGDGAQTTVTVTGAVLGDLAEASFSLDTQGIILKAQVTASDTVTVRFQNETGSTIDLASGTIRVKVRAHPTRTAIRSEIADLWSGIRMADGITTAARFNVIAPYHWSDGNIVGLKLYHCQSTTNSSKNVRIRVRAITKAAGASVSTPEEDETFTVAVNDAALRFTTTTVTFGTPLAFAAGDFAGFRIGRLGADGSDDAAGDWFLAGAAVLYEGEGPDSAGSGTWNVPPIGV